MRLGQDLDYAGEEVVHKALFDALKLKIEIIFLGFQLLRSNDSGLTGDGSKLLKSLNDLSGVLGSQKTLGAAFFVAVVE